MRCKKHVTDLSSAVGVCASCLRERLLVVIAVQEQAQAGRQHASASASAAVHYDDRLKSEPMPPPLVFPRSVSPYISRRKSDTSATIWDDPRQLKNHRHQNTLPDHRFYSTPQIGPNGTLIAAVDPFTKKRRGIKFSFFGHLFRPKSGKLDSDPSCSASGQVMDSGKSCALPAPSPSWFSSIFPARRKKQNKTFFIEESTIGYGQRRTRRNPDRGMSPARHSDEEDEHCNNASSGYSSECSQPWKQTPKKTPAAVPRGKRCGGGGGGRPGLSRNVSGMTLCLSPLVRASPGRHWNKKGVPPEMVVAGDIKVIPMKPAITNAAPFCKNRSRKLADFGRFHRNH